MTDSQAFYSSDNKQDNTGSAAPKIAIIGGGLTGLFTATLLEQAVITAQKTAHITIFEKSRSIGRLATRYRRDEKTDKNWQWSFGAQFFTAKSADFKQFIAPQLSSKLLQPWCAQVVTLTPANREEQDACIKPKEQWDQTHARYISTPKMTSWGRKLADELQFTTLKFKTRVAPLAQYSHLQTDKQTELFNEHGESLGVFDWVVCTAPNVQAADLMTDTSFIAQAKILQPKMLACYTLMLGWDEAQPLPDSVNHKMQPDWDVAYITDSILDRMFIEHHKPNYDQLLPSVTIHASNEWSEQQVDEDIDTIKRQLVAAAKRALNWQEQTAPTQIDCHRWRYAATITDNQEPLGVLVDKQHQWIVCGDWCGQGHIESCYQAAADTVAAIAPAL